MTKSEKEKLRRRARRRKNDASLAGALIGGLGSGLHALSQFGLFSPWAPVGLAEVTQGDTKRKEIIRASPWTIGSSPYYNELLNQAYKQYGIDTFLDEYYAAAMEQAQQQYDPGTYKLVPNEMEEDYRRRRGHLVRHFPDLDKTMPKSPTPMFGPTAHSLLYSAGPVSSVALSSLIPFFQNPWQRIGLGLLGLATHAYPFYQELQYGSFNDSRALPILLSSLFPIGTAAFTNLVDVVSGADRYLDEDDEEEE